MGVKILRHRTGLLYKRCQTILWLKQIHVSFKHRQKIRFDSSCQQQNITCILKIVIAKAGGGGSFDTPHFSDNPHRKKRKDQNTKYIIKSEWQHIFKPFSPNSDQHEFSPNNIHMLSREMVMRINQMITKEKMLCPFIKISQLTVSLGNVWISVRRICMWILGLNGKANPQTFQNNAPANSIWKGSTIKCFDIENLKVANNPTLTLAWHSVGLQHPPLLTQPSNSLDISLSRSFSLGTVWSTYSGPTKKKKSTKYIFRVSYHVGDVNFYHYYYYFIYLFILFFLQFRDFSNSYNGCPYTRLLSNTSCVKAIRSKISSNFTLHLSKVGKLKQLFKKVSSNLKTILMTD